MRELKFRAWVEWTEKPRFEYSGNNYPDTFWNNYNDGDNVEQYTGLKDKNGKEIYEGDVVKILDAPVVKNKVLIVKFDEFNIGEYNCNKMTGWMVQTIDEGWASSLADVISSCEVIGNIHENISQ